VPPLRERRDEILPLVEFFLIKYASRYGRPAAKPSQRLRDVFLNYSWPGNVRELENVLKRFVILQDETLELAELQRPRHLEPQTPLNGTPAPEPVEPIVEHEEDDLPAEAQAHLETSLDAMSGPSKLPELARRAALSAEREAIQQALDRFRWNRRKAAQLLGVSYKTLLNKMKECGISAPNE
jgi:DNA-binding NtrC family response regulator